MGSLYIWPEFTYKVPLSFLLIKELHIEMKRYLPLSRQSSG